MPRANEYRWIGCAKSVVAVGTNTVRTGQGAGEGGTRRRASQDGIGRVSACAMSVGSAACRVGDGGGRWDGSGGGGSAVVTMGRVPDDDEFVAEAAGEGEGRVNKCNAAASIGRTRLACAGWLPAKLRPGGFVDSFAAAFCLALARELAI